MSNYEIMLILDPNSDDKIVSEIANSTFASKSLKIEKLERKELAYEINKSKTAIYYLVKVNASGEEINEFTRKTNIAKNIWRTLSINLDQEKGLNRKAKPKKVRKPFVRRNTNMEGKEFLTQNNNSSNVTRKSNVRKEHKTDSKK